MGMLDILRRPFSRSAPAAAVPAAPVATPAAAPAAPAVPATPAPSRLNRRQAARNFHAAMLDRLNATWTTTPLTADQIIDKHWRVLVARSREQAQSNDYARKFCTLIKANVIGATNIQLQAKVRDPDGTIDTLASESIEDKWGEWGKRGNCEITGKLNFLQVCNLAIQSACVDGEIIAIMIEGEGPHDFQIQLVDAMRLDVDLMEETEDGNFIRHGIEFTPVGRPVAYYFTALDDRIDDYYSFRGKKYQRVPAEKVIHEFLPEQIGQKRGLPWMATPLQRMAMLGGYEQAALVAARVGAAKMGILYPDPDGDQPEDDPDIITDADPGTFWVAPTGWKAEKWDMAYPQEFATFTKAALRGISAGLGVAYNNLANDLEGVNFSSIRQGTLDEREIYKLLQAWFAEVFHDRIYERWLRIQLLRQSILVVGKPLKLEREAKYRAVSWQGRRWSWVDPEADQNAAIKGVQNRFSSRAQVILDQGRDPTEVEAELQAEEAADDARLIARVQELQRQCEAANKAMPGLALHWSQLITAGGATSAPGAYLAAVAQTVQAGAQAKQAGEPSKTTPSTKPKE